MKRGSWCREIAELTLLYASISAFESVTPMMLAFAEILVGLCCAVASHTPAPHSYAQLTLHSNVSSLSPAQHPPVQPQQAPPAHITEADLIAAGMQYFRTLTGNQHF